MKPIFKLQRGLWKLDREERHRSQRAVLAIVAASAVGLLVAAMVDAADPQPAWPALEKRIEAIEKSLGFDVPVDRPVTPAFVRERAADKEKNGKANRRRKLFQHINNQLDYQYADTGVASADIGELFVKPKDAILEAVVEEYKKEGWTVEYIPGPSFGNNPKTDNGHWRFSIKAEQADAKTP